MPTQGEDLLPTASSISENQIKKKLSVIGTGMSRVLCTIRVNILRREEPKE